MTTCGSRRISGWHPMYGTGPTATRKSNLTCSRPVPVTAATRVKSGRRSSNAAAGARKSCIVGKPAKRKTGPFTRRVRIHSHRTSVAGPLRYPLPFRHRAIAGGAGCKEHRQQKDFLKALMAGRSTPKGDDAPIVASTDFTSNGFSTTFHNN